VAANYPLCVISSLAIPISSARRDYLNCRTCAMTDLPRLCITNPSVPAERAEAVEAAQ
jgi:hypothetical protein